MAISGYPINGYWWLLLMTIGGYAIYEYSINGYWVLLYKGLLVVILLMTISGYCINGY